MTSSRTAGCAAGAMRWRPARLGIHLCQHLEESTGGALTPHSGQVGSGEGSFTPDRVHPRSENTARTGAGSQSAPLFESKVFSTGRMNPGTRSNSAFRRVK